MRRHEWRRGTHECVRHELGRGSCELAIPPIYGLERYCSGAEPAMRMDYYAELGVDRTATPQEIRQAYRRLVRLVHPDHCDDEALRPLADQRMKRLNGILEALMDPAERARYDYALAGRMVIALPLPHGDLEAPVPPPRWFWPLAAVLLLAGFISLGWIPQSRPGAGGAISVAAQPAVEGPAVPSRHRQA